MARRFSGLCRGWMTGVPKRSPASVFELTSGGEGCKAALRCFAASWHCLRVDEAVKDAFGAAERLVLDCFVHTRHPSPGLPFI